MICRIKKNIKKDNCNYMLSDVKEIFLLNYGDMSSFFIDDCEYCVSWEEDTRWYRLDVENCTFEDALTIGQNDNKYRKIKLSFSLTNWKTACLQDSYNEIVLGKYVAVFFTNGRWYVSGLLNGMTVNESASDSESHTIVLEEDTVLTSQIMNDECAEDVVASANGEEPEPPTPPTPVITDLIGVFDVDDISEPTKILDNYASTRSQFSSMDIDAVSQPEVVSYYQFDTTGTHFVKYVLIDDTTLPEGVFYRCYKLVDVYLPETLTSISENAFFQCENLTNITIPNSVTSFGKRAFEGCTGLTSITIPNSVTSIGNYAFEDCTGLTNITIPNNVTTINTGVFEDCSSLTSVTIPSGVTSIGNSVFEDCSSLTSITIPNSVTTIGSYAFSGCTSLTSITIPSGVQTIGNNAFYGCGNLASITVQATTPPTLGTQAFDNTNDCPIYVPCESLTAYQTAWSTYSSRIMCDQPQPVGSDVSIIFNATSTAQDYKVGNGWRNVFSSMKIDGEETDMSSQFYYFTVGTHYGEYTLIDSTNLGLRALYNVDNIINVRLPNTVTTIGESSFAQMDGITSIGISGSNADVEIPNSVTTLIQYAFYSCSNLTSITLPSSITSIGKQCFDGCRRLTSFTILATTPPTLGNSALSNTNDCHIYVPAESVTAYQTASGWSAYSSRIQAIP